MNMNHNWFEPRAIPDLILNVSCRMYHEKWLLFPLWICQVELEDIETAKERNSIDDEYAMAGVRDPKVCVTTSRDPSSRLKQFAKELKLVVPNAQRINRGNHKVRK